MFPRPDLARMSREELLHHIGRMSNDFDALLREKDARILRLDNRVEELQRRIDWLQRQVFGAISERRILKRQSYADQLWLGEQMLEPTEQPPPDSTTVKAYERAQRKSPVEFVDSDSQLRFDATVPVKVIEIPNPATTGLAEDEFEQIGERCTYRLAQERGPYVVLKYVQKVVKIKGKEEVSCPPAPGAVIERSSADVSFLAGMVQDKFQFHMPLYRQHQRLEQAGVYLDRGTLTRLTHRVGELLEPVYHAMLSSVLLSQLLTVDESPTRAGRGDGKMKTGYFWALYGDQDEVAFLFSPTRSKKVLDDVLKGFQGKLMSDGYVIYELLAGESGGKVIPVQCWAHTRRQFVEAEKVAPAEVQQVLGWIQDLYKVENTGRGDPRRLLQLRQEHSKPIMDHIFDFLEQALQESVLLPSNPFLKAANYAVQRKVPLQVCLEDATVPLDTNHVERALRPQAVGRKNWMFHVTEVGARHAAIFYTLIQSCRLCQVDPSVYLVDVLQRIDRHPAFEVHLLTPRLWKEREFPASVLGLVSGRQVAS